MASPIYFFPHVRRDQVVSAKTNRLEAWFLRERGVAPAFVGVRDVQLQTSCWELPGKGPGGQSGLLITVLPAGEAPVRIGYFPDAQQWFDRPAGADCWVGVDREYPPTPAELAHVERPAGHLVTLGDGHDWRVPIIRCPFGREELGRSQLTREFGYDQQGRFQAQRSADSDALWELSGVAWDHFFNHAENPAIDFEIVVGLAIGALGLNYRVGKAEQQVLRLINSSNWDATIRAVLDVPLLDELAGQQKKTEEFPAPPPSNVSPGAEA